MAEYHYVNEEHFDRAHWVADPEGRLMTPAQAANEAARILEALSNCYAAMGDKRSALLARTPVSLLDGLALRKAARPTPGGAK